MSLLLEIGMDDILLEVCTILGMYLILVEDIVCYALRWYRKRVALCGCWDYVERILWVQHL